MKATRAGVQSNRGDAHWCRLVECLDHVGKRFELGEDDELRVLVNHDRDLMRAVADGHAVRE
jgi:hypothetical protein